MIAAHVADARDGDDGVLDCLAPSRLTEVRLDARRERPKIPPQLVAKQAEKEVPDEPADASRSERAPEDVPDQVTDRRPPRGCRAEHDPEDHRKNVRRANARDPGDYLKRLERHEHGGVHRGDNGNEEHHPCLAPHREYLSHQASHCERLA